MQVRVLFFGVLRDVAGMPELRLEVPEPCTLGDVFRRCAERFPRMQAMAGSIVLARNREFGDPASAVGEGDEIALLPPVSGGTGAYREEVLHAGNFFALTRHPIDVGALSAAVLRGSDGAVVTFEGVVRNNTAGKPVRWLEYEGYEAMAVKVMARIGAEIAAGFQIGRIAMVHRLGRMLIGETSVAIVVAAPHRAAAFEAARAAIDRLKRLAPIWKKEVFVDGEIWVEGEWERGVPTAR